MKKIYILLFILSAIGYSGLTQGKELTMQEAVVGQFRELNPAYLKNLQWRSSLDEITHINEKNELISQGIKSGTSKVLLTIDELNAALYSSDVDSVKVFPFIVWKTSNEFRFRLKQQYILFNITTKLVSSVVTIPEGENLLESVKGDFVVTRDHDLYIITREGKENRITHDGKPGIVYGQSVHRNEFGINGGLFWSPSGNYLAFYRMDETMVTDYPLVNTNTRIAEVSNIKYPMAGMKSHEVTLGVYDLRTNQQLYLETGEPVEQYLTAVTWDPSEKFICVALLNREQNHLKLHKFDRATGKSAGILFEEKHPKYVEPEHPLTFIKNDPTRFIWQSERDGYNHLYLYSMDGKLVNQLTKGEWEVSRILGMNANGTEIFIETTQDNPTGRQISKVNLKSGKLTRITTSAGTHDGILNQDGNYLIDHLSSVKVPRKYDLLSASGKWIRTVFEAENPLSDYDLPELTFITLKADDGKTDLYGRIIKPRSMDPQTRYPAIIYVYGGPHAQLVTDTWLGGARLWEYYMAQKGYVMLTIDNRGSAHRGLEFENCIHRALGSAEVADQMKGVDYLRSLGYVDMDRVGVHGWSYGGFMTISMLTDHPKDFKAGVAGGPVIDWKYYEVMYGERYMDMPQENPDGYKMSSLIEKAGNLESNLLIIHGAMDNTVVMQHSLNFLDACIKNKKQVDFFVYPNHEHNVRGFDRIHLMEKVTRYFDDYLK
jgi:dipeptidyl-peptidase-4